MEFLISPNFWSSVLASTTPVLLATLAANIMTKAGMFNLGIEGTMLMQMCIRDRFKVIFAELADYTKDMNAVGRLLKAEKFSDVVQILKNKEV